MRRLAKLPVWYSIVSDALSLLVIVLLLISSGLRVAGGHFQDILFFLLVVSYLNCLPLAIVSIFLIVSKDKRKYGLTNVAAMVIVLYFAVKVFGTAI